MPHQPALLRPYWESISHLTMVDDLFMHDDDGKAIPTGMPLQILGYIHTGHLGLTKCRPRAPISVWWPRRLGIQWAYVSHEPKNSVQRQENCLCNRPFYLTPGKELQQPCINLMKENASPSRLSLTVVRNQGTPWWDISRSYKNVATHGVPDVIMSGKGPQ